MISICAASINLMKNVQSKLDSINYTSKYQFPGYTCGAIPGQHHAFMQHEVHLAHAVIKL